MMRALSLGGVPQPVVNELGRRYYGLLDIDTWRGHKTATGEELLTYLDGVEIKSAVRAHDKEGFVETWLGVAAIDSNKLYVPPTAGHLQEQLIQDYLARGKGEYIGDRKVRLYGDVRIAPQVDLTQVTSSRLVSLIDAREGNSWPQLANAYIDTVTWRNHHDLTWSLGASTSSSRFPVYASGIATRLLVNWMERGRFWPLPQPIELKLGVTMHVDVNWQEPGFEMLRISDLTLADEGYTP